LVTIGGALALGAIFLARAKTTPAPTPTTVEPAATVPPPREAKPAPEALVEATLESTPPGALVTVDGVAIGTTPMKWRTRPADKPTALTFTREGYRPETITALPADGLRLAPTLAALEPAKPTKAATKSIAKSHGHAPKLEAPPALDIKSER
jgi:hypothetical protein